jgi:hypothetical protein
MGAAKYQKIIYANSFFLVLRETSAILSGFYGEKQIPLAGFHRP